MSVNIEYNEIDVYINEVELSCIFFPIRFTELGKLKIKTSVLILVSKNFKK